MISSFLRSKYFSILDLASAICSGVVWILFPQANAWPLLIVLVPWIIRFFSGRNLLPKTNFNIWIGIYLLFAVFGYRISYAEAPALSKMWAVVGSVFICYALARQSKDIRVFLSILFYTFGILISAYYFLGNTFLTEPTKIQLFNEIGAWWLRVRPSTSFRIPDIHPNYIAGLAVLGSLFGIYLLWVLRQTKKNITWFVLLILGYVIVFFTLVYTASRGIWLAIGSALGVLLLWWLLRFFGSYFSIKLDVVYPVAVLCFLTIVVLVLYLGPAQTGYETASQQNYGSDSRAEVFDRSLILISDFPYTGGGLGSFPGLYSRYILSIPYNYLPNSHNLFLDVAIEQGIISGLAFLFLYIGSVWKVSRLITRQPSVEWRVFDWLVLFSLVIVIIHGMVDDYLYNNKGAILSLAFVGLSMWVLQGKHVENGRHKNNNGYRDLDKNILIPSFLVILILTIGLANSNLVRSKWYSNMGAVQMAQYDLRNFPDAGWDEGRNVEELTPAKLDFLDSIRLYSANVTANYRLGLISMLQRDFDQACGYLKSAYDIAPTHRGIIKNLGYCYVWLNEFDQAERLLKLTPEAENELDVYQRWWISLGEDELSERAMRMGSLLSSKK